MQSGQPYLPVGAESLPEVEAVVGGIGLAQTGELACMVDVCSETQA